MDDIKSRIIDVLGFNFKEGKMYKNIGRTIKDVVNIIVIVPTVLYFLFVTLDSFMYNAGFIWFFFRMLIGVVLWIILKIAGMVLYGFGELIENVTQINENLKTQISTIRLPEDNQL